MRKTLKLHWRFLTVHNPSVPDRLFPHSDKLSSKKNRAKYWDRKTYFGPFFPRHRKQLVFVQEIFLKIAAVVVLMFLANQFLRNFCGESHF